MWWRPKPESLGRRGERAAARYLWFRGYRILEQNLHLGRYEIDILAQQGDTIVFVEVKTRRRDDATDPHDSVGPAKEMHIKTAAEMYMARHPSDELYYRFDIVSVVYPERGRPRIEHLPDAFR
ncbi:MAG: YraN family protein [Candidatus Hydrogenedens sp.]|nr:YraN family protein [Candidatus Hydrogenedens sp.]